MRASVLRLKHCLSSNSTFRPLFYTSYNSLNSSAITSKKCDALVIGGGIAGTCMAYELSKLGLSVIVLEQEYMPGYHSTGRAAGLFSENYGTQAVKILSMYSRSFFENPPKDCITNDQPPILTPCGLLSVTEVHNHQHFIDNCGPPSETDQSIFAQYSRKNLKFIKKEQAVELCPYLNMNTMADSVLYEPNATLLDIGLVHASYIRGCKAQNIPILCNMRVDKLTKSEGNGNWETLVNADRNDPIIFESGLVVNASGAWVDEIAIKAGLKPKNIQPLRRCILTFGSSNKEIGELLSAHINNEHTLPWVMGLDDELKEHWYTAPHMKSGLFLASPANRDLDEVCDAQITDLESAICVDRIERYTHLKISKIVSRWAGHRCHSTDNNPVIGPDPSDPSFIWTAALAGQGIQSCYGYSQVCANVAVGKDIPMEIIDMGFEFNDISPKRFL